MKKKLEQQQIDLEAQEVELKELQKKYKKEAEEWKAKEEALNAEAARLASIAAGNSGNALDILKKIGHLEKGCAWPTVTHYISSEYGYRIHPIYGDKRFHNGLDIAGRHNDPIYAATAGVVDTASNGWNGGYGNMVIIIGEKYTTLYGHLNSIACKAGQVVRPGQLIGYMGTTGSSTGDHLHFTVFLTGTETTINPHSIIGY